MFDRFKLTATHWNEVPNMLLAQLRGWGTEGDDENAEPFDDSPFLQQLGVAVFPIVRSTLRGLGWRYGDEIWLLKVWDKARKLFDMEKGETRIYAVGDENTRVRMRQSGTIQVEAQTVTLGRGEGQSVARVDDQTGNGRLEFQVAGSALRITYHPPGGAPQITTIGFASTAGVTLALATGGTLDLSGTIRTGSQVVKAE